MPTKTSLVHRYLFAVAVVLAAFAWGGASAQPHDEPTQILDAARNGDGGAVLYYLKKGVSPQTQDKTGQTALMVAAGLGYSSIVDMLIDADARLDIQDSFGRSALSWAAVGGHVDIVERLLGRGADINVQTTEGLTPLMLAVKEAHSGTVETLIDGKPDLNMRDYTGRSALGWARAGRVRRIERMLHRAGARE